MVGSAVAGPNFQPENVDSYFDYFQDLSLLLMASRFVLMLQYMTALFFTKHYKRVRVPLILIIANCFVAGLAYLSLYFAFWYVSSSPHAYIGWYVIAVAETAITTLVSSIWRLVSFKGTHMLQRMSLLTLVILGEGIIELTKSITAIVKNYNNFSSAVIGDIVAAVLVIYFFFLVYFHRLQDRHIGTFRQQIWSFLHFPFHVALVIALEGSQQFILWRQGVQLGNDLSTEIDDVLSNYDLDTPQSAEVYGNIAERLKDIAYNGTFDWAPDGLDIQPFMESFDNALEAFRNVSAEIVDGAINATDALVTSIYKIESILSDAIFNEVGIAVEGEESDNSNPSEAAESEDTPQWVGLFKLVYAYTFVSAGLALMIIGVLGLISHKPKTTGGWIRAVVTLAVGLGITLLSIMVVTIDEFANSVVSPWVLPTLTLSYFIVVGTDNIRRH